MCLYTVAVIGWEESQVASVGVAPARVLHVVTVAVVGPVLARLAREVDFERAPVGQHRVAHVHGRQGEGDLLLCQFQSILKPKLNI